MAMMHGRNIRKINFSPWRLFEYAVQNFDNCIFEETSAKGGMKTTLIVMLWSSGRLDMLISSMFSFSASAIIVTKIENIDYA